jgi:hypothetical protein
MVCSTGSATAEAEPAAAGIAGLDYMKSFTLIACSTGSATAGAEPAVVGSAGLNFTSILSYLDGLLRLLARPQLELSRLLPVSQD